MAARATALLGSGERLLLADLVLAESVYVLESFYELERERVATLMRAIPGVPQRRAARPGDPGRAATRQEATSWIRSPGSRSPARR
jgi:hypothetical protein